MFWNVFFEGAIYTQIFFPNSDSKLKKNKNFVNSWCFNNKNIFTAVE